MPLSNPISRVPGAVALLSLAGALWPTSTVAGSVGGDGGEGYKLGDEVPVSCLNRTLDGEHITDSLGKLQYVPFVTCNETSRPLSIHYGVSETITCTVPALSDTLYHLLEFYVHSDVPMTCRVPTAPLTQANAFSSESKNDAESDESGSLAALNDNGPPFTPVTVALQGTLQRSHLHIWTDMNMLMHNMASDAAAQDSTDNKQSGQPGYAVAGTAYSTPEFETAMQNVKLDEDDKAIALAQAAREPWTPGHGTKVIRGEPLTFSFHVAWVEGGAGIGWPDRPASYSFLGPGGKVVVKGSGSSSFFSRVFFFLMAASVGALGALYWERNGGRLRGRPSWKGDGILGVPPARGKGSNVSFGNGGRINGYGGYSSSGMNGNGTGNGTGYGGFMTGKKD
ncbi:hypothetical protein PENSTE_c001G08979 [Penicillium steckii]|uniref:Uncharacterized protein n=1 Tax=Penicillium steckii TaxID=303698 RepID=A0A1V6U047_9EURO|nr:hypothetical protein PENSTE_c001G08979 [Penicillium steckii]